MNIERYRMVMHRIWADLRGWQQRHIHSTNWYQLSLGSRVPRHYCGTSHCVAGWAEILSGESSPGYESAIKWLGLTKESEVDWLFSGSRTLADLKAVLKRGRVFE